MILFQYFKGQSTQTLQFDFYNKTGKTCKMSKKKKKSKKMQKKNEKKKKYLLNIWSGAKAVIKHKIINTTIHATH